MSGSAPYVVRVVVGRVPGVGGADEVDDQLVGGQGPVRGGRWAGRAVVDLDPEGQSCRLDRSQRGPAHAHPYPTRFEDLHPVGDQPAGGVVVVVQVASRGALHIRQPIGLQRAQGDPVALDSGDGSAGLGAARPHQQDPGGDGRDNGGGGG